MQLKTFFNQLLEFYEKGASFDYGKKRKVYCKYYLQATSFSYSLFVFPFAEEGETEVQDFTREPDFMSDVFYDWNSKKARKAIIKEVLKKSWTLAYSYSKTTTD